MTFILRGKPRKRVFISVVDDSAKGKIGSLLISVN